MLIEAPALKHPGLRHGFFTREGGVSAGLYASLNTGLGSDDDPAAVAENRRRIAACVGVAADRLVTVYQVHGTDVVAVEGPLPDRPKADALVTRMPGLAIAVSSADCGPILLADPGSGVIGAAHAGWRGALSGVAERTVDAMERLGAKRGAIVAAIGPMISARAFEVGDEVRAAFDQRHGSAHRFFLPAVMPDKWLLDLPGFLVWRLREAGVSAESLDLCTYSQPERFFSYRRKTHRGEADYGRHLSAIVLA